jgi:hypothetical protein
VQVKGRRRRRSNDVVLNAWINKDALVLIDESLGSRE